MSGSRWAVSGLLVLHLTAVALGFIPEPSGLKKVDPPRHPTGDALAAALTPVVDRVAAVIYQALTAAWSTLSPLPETSQAYLRSMGLGQQWIMFWDPPKQDVYIRLRYFVGYRGDSKARPVWLGTELVLPAERDDRVRLMHSYWTKDLDKTLFTALDHFVKALKPSMLRPDARPGELPDDLIPVVRYFGRRFAKNRLTADERLVRTEVWYGSGFMPPRGLVAPAVQPSRLEVLGRYYSGPTEEYLAEGPYHEYFAQEREGDIFWRLEYFEEP